MNQIIVNRKRQQIGQLKAQIEELEQECRELEKIDELEEIIGKLHKDNDILKNENRELKDYIVHLKNDLAEMIRENNRLKEIIECLQKELADMKIKNCELMEIIERLEKELEVTRIENSSLKEITYRLEKKLEEMRIENSRLKEIIDYLQKEREEMSTENRELKMKLECVKEENSKLLDFIDSLIKELEKAKKLGYPVELDIMERDIANMKDTKDVSAEEIESWFVKAPGHGLDDVSGMDEITKSLLDFVTDIGSDKYKDGAGGAPVQFFFFYGLPGTGKTYYIDAFANDLMKQGFKYMRVHLGDFRPTYKGESEKRIKAVFREAVRNAPCVVFIDEIEGILMKCDSKTPEFEKSLKEAFLQAYNEAVDSGARVILMGATNYPVHADITGIDNIHIIKIPLPDFEARKAFLMNKLERCIVADELSFDTMAEKTENYSFHGLNRIVDAIRMLLWDKAINGYEVLSEDGTLNKQKTDAVVAAAISEGKIRLNSDMFNEALLACPPADMSLPQKAIREFEAQLMSKN